MTAITASLNTGAATDGSGRSVIYPVLKVPMDVSQQTYSVAGRGGKVSLVSVFGVVASGRSVEIIAAGVQLLYLKALSAEAVIDTKRQTDELAAETFSGLTDVVFNFGTTGAATDVLTVVLATPL